MFDLTPTPAQTEALAAVRGLREEIRESARGSNESGQILDELRRRIAAAGQATPEAIADGSSVLVDPVGLVLIAEEIAIADAGTAFAVIGSVLADIVAAGNGPLDDAAPMSLAFYEGFGRGPSELRTTVAADGDTLRLTGRKESVVYGASAKTFLVVAREGDGLGLFRVAASAGGVSVERDDLEVGALALGAARTALVRFDGAEAERVSAAGDPLVLQRALAAARLLLPAISVGVGQAAVDSAAEWVSGRSVRGAGLAVNQGVTFPLVDADIAVSRARLLVWDIASQLATITDGATVERKTGRAVAIGCEAGSAAARVACNTMGWRGLSQRYAAEMRYRDTSLLTAIDFDPLQHTNPVLQAV